MKREPWNKGRAVGPRKAFSRDEINKIANSFQPNETFEECLFMVSVDSMLRSSDLLNLKVCDLKYDSGEFKEYHSIRQKKTKRNVSFCLSKKTLLKCRNWIDKSNKSNIDFLFSNPFNSNSNLPISAVTYRRIVKSWCKRVNLNEELYSTHSLRRSKPTWLYHQGVEIEKIALILGHKSPDATMRYLSISTNEVIETLNSFNIFRKSY